MLEPDFVPMEAKTADRLPETEGWQFEPKWDGFRCLAFRAGKEVELLAKSGKSLLRYFPDMARAIGGLEAGNFVLDGELTIPIGDTLSFEALQSRLHPAESRVKMLAAASPALFIAFDCLATEADGPLLAAPLSQRRAALERIGKNEFLRLSPFTRDREKAQNWLDHAGGALDGVMAKRIDGPYRPGERDMLKIKRLRTADCVVGGFRYAKGSREVGSMLLGLFNGHGKLDHVGFTSAISNAERPALTKKLEALMGPPGFTGDAPGGPSRWSTPESTEWQSLRTELVAEVRYDHVTGDRFRHGTMFLRWRPDKAPEQCTFDQMEPEIAPEKLFSTILSPSG